MLPPQDLVALVEHQQQPTLEAIYNALARRHDLGLPYTRIGTSTLVAINPNRPLNIYSEANGQLYIDLDKSSDKGDSAALEPHVFELASTIYYHMKHTGLDQGVVLSGLAGSGKTTSQNHLVQQFIRLGSKSSQRQAQESKIGSQIRASRDILEAFCNCPSEYGPNSSFASLYLELQFKGRGRLFGAKLLPFMLNQDRVTDSHLGSYHIFYAMLRDASSEDRRRLRLGHNDHPSTFPYLATSQHSSQPYYQTAAVRDITTAFSAMGIKSRSLFEIWQILAAILHLSRLEFADSDQEPSLLSTIPRNRAVLELVAELLGVEDEALQQALVYKRKMISGDMCTVILNPEAAKKQCDSLARGLYALLFTFVVEAMNKQMCRKQEEQTSFIGILDMPGFDTQSPAGFETLCNNFCNEAMQAYLRQKLLIEDTQALVADGLNLLEPIPLSEQTMSTMDLMCGLDTLTDDGQPRGLVRFLHDSTLAAEKQSQQSSYSESDPSSMLPGMSRTFQSNSSFVSGSTYDSSFGIRHFVGQVQYSVNNFYTKNQDIMAPDFVSLFQTSNSPFMQQLLQSNPSLVLESHPRSKDTIVKAQLSTMPLRQPSIRHSKMVQFQAKRKGRATAPAVTTVVKQLHSTLRDICTSLDGTQLYQVIHLRPNNGIKEGHTDCDPVLLRSQIEAFGLPELAQVRSITEHCVSYDHATFMQRYKALLSHENVTIDKSISPADQCRAVANHFQWNIPRDAAIGREYIWLTLAAWRPIEDSCASLERKNLGQSTSFEADLSEQQEFARMMSATTGRGSHDQGLPFGNMAPAVHTPGSEAMEPLLERPSFRDRQGSDASDHSRASHIYPVLETGFVGYDNSHLRPQFDVVPPSPMSDERTIGTHGADADSRHHIYPGFDKNDMELKHRPTKSALKRSVSKLGSRRTKADESVQPPKAKTKTRRAWVAFVWCNTFWIPSFLLSWCGRMKRPDVQMAWREKVTLCLIVFWLSAFIIFFIIGVPKLMCPDYDQMYNPETIQYHNTPTDTWVAIRGVVYDVTKFAKTEHSGAFAQTFSSAANSWESYRGQDLTEMFPVDLRWACPGLVDSNVLLNPEIPPSGYMPVHGPNVQNSVQNLPWFQDQAWFSTTALPKLNTMKKGMIAIPINDFKNQTGPHTWAMMHGKIYDLTPYLRSASPTPPFMPDASFTKFIDQSVVDLFLNNIGTDISSQFKDLPLSAAAKASHMTCLDRAFYAGVLDVRDTVKCQFGNWVLLAASALMAGVILIKFLAALQLRGRGPPIKYDKFVICQVPCYTEGEESLRKTISSLAGLEYDDKHKLLFVIADGMIVGHGNELPTPKIVLDVLGWKPPMQQDAYGYSATGSVADNGEPEPVTYKALGLGGQQLNACKVYSGLYEFEGHLVPYIVVAKVGMPSETTKPGNRGKRDSQLILMKFLNAIHTNKKMCPLELELYHHMKNIIGVHPNLYEYILQVDADTEVEPDSLNRLVACCVNDSRVIGLCGETRVANEDRSFTTMIQVYEYYISHHLAKSFESLFGSVTCLPGCFSIYRVFSLNGKPLIVSNKVVEDYSHNDVDTLHKKNLLHLGEDRYLTTLMMKHFPQFKLKFTPDAFCKTVAPDKWKVLLSQRRRWINSTIHNLGELMVLQELCGFCCFSMRFIVFVDLLGTLILPASFAYLVYLIIIIATDKSPLPLVALCMLAAVYGLQALIFILKGAWQHIGWMIIYILAMPFFSVFIPLYSFWHFDDFSWGNTRQVVDANGRKIVVNAEAQTRFDPNSIPLKSLEAFEAEQREKLAHAAAAAAAVGVAGTPVMSQVGPYSTSSTSEHNLTNSSGHNQYLDPNYPPGVHFGGRTSPYGHGNPYEYDAMGSDEMVHDYYRDSNAIEMEQSQNNAKGQRLSRMSAIAGGPLLPGMGGGIGTPTLGAPGVPRPVSPAQFFAEQREMKEQQERMRQMSGGSSVMAASAGGMLMPPHEIQDGRISPGYMSSPMQPAQPLPGSGMVLTMGTPQQIAYGSPALTSMAPPQIPFTMPSGSPALSPAMFNTTVGGATSPLMMTTGVGGLGNSMAQLPSDDELVLRVREILRSGVDLMSVTKKTIRQQLEQFYGCDLTLKKDFLSQVIDVELQRMASGAH